MQRICANEKKHIEIFKKLSKMEVENELKNKIINELKTLYIKNLVYTNISNKEFKVSIAKTIKVG